MAEITMMFPDELERGEGCVVDRIYSPPVLFINKEKQTLWVEYKGQKYVFDPDKDYVIVGLGKNTILDINFSDVATFTVKLHEEIDDVLRSIRQVVGGEKESNQINKEQRKNLALWAWLGWSVLVTIMSLVFCFALMDLVERANETTSRAIELAEHHEESARRAILFAKLCEINSESEVDCIDK